MKRILFPIVVAFTAIISTNAQLITWSVKPGIYTNIEPCWGDMYFVYQGNSIGVINGDGRVIVSPDASRITGFYGGYALVLKLDGGRERIIGVLTSEGTYNQVNDPYYTIPNQEFFSEGFVTVTNPQGYVGYMNTHGSVDKQFDVTYATPYSEGYAAVGEGEDFSIIDKRFNSLQINLPSMSPLYGGSNVYKGEAVVWDGNGSPFRFNVKNGRCDPINDKSIKKATKSQQIDWDYLGCFSLITNRAETVSYDLPKRSSQTLSPTERGNKYGYEQNGKILLPFQFDLAEAFHGNYAVVKLNGKPALLVLHNSTETFGAVPINSEIIYKRNESENLQHNFRITVPSLWNVEKIIAKTKNDNGIYIPTTNNEGSFEFLSDASEDGKKFSIELESDGLKLWSGDIAYNYMKQKIVDSKSESHEGFKPFTVSLKAKNTQADKNNRCYVEATISNPNSETISAMVVFKGSNLLEAVEKRVSVPAYGKIEISTFFKVTKAVTGQEVTVSTTAGGTAKLDGLQLIPF